MDIELIFQLLPDTIHDTSRNSLRHRKRCNGTLVFCWPIFIDSTTVNCLIEWKIDSINSSS